MKIGLVQYSPEWENPTDSIIKLNELIDKQYNNEELLIFPEMTLTGFTMDSEKHAEDIDGIGMSFFINLAQKKRLMYLLELLKTTMAKFIIL